MSSEAPPTYNVSVFIPSYWVSSTEGFDKAYADTHYLKFPVGQGTEYIPDLVVSGTTTLGATSVSSLNMGGGNITNVTNINGSAYPPSSSTAGINDVLGVGNQATNKTMIMNGAGGGGSTNNLQLDGDGAYFYGAFASPQTSTLSRTGLIFNSGPTDCNITKDGITLVLDNTAPTIDKTEIFNDSIDLIGSSATISNKLTPISSIIADATYTATLISNALSLFTNSVTTTRNAITNLGMTITGSTGVTNTLTSLTHTITDATRTLLFGISSSVATIKLNASSSGGNSTLITPNSITNYSTDGATTNISNIANTGMTITGSTSSTTNTLTSGEVRVSASANNYGSLTPNQVYLSVSSSIYTQIAPSGSSFAMIMELTNNFFSTDGSKASMIIRNRGSSGTGNDNCSILSLQRIKGSTSAVGDVVGMIQGFGNYTGTLLTEFGRISTIIKTISSTPTSNCGAMSFQTAVNNVSTPFLEINGADNQIDALKPLDMNNNSIVSSTGDITLNASASSGTGNINLTTKSTGGLIFTGTALQSNTSGGNSGEHLVITLNGVPYKIALQNP